MRLQWAMAGCKPQALSMLEALDRRGRRPQFLAVPPHAPAVDLARMEDWAREHDVELVLSKRLVEHADRLDGLDLLLVCRFELLSADVFTRPRLGTVNVHSSLLPAYRGIHPVSWALVEGATATGVSVHLIDEGVDTGRLLRQAALRIEDDHDLHSLTRALDDLSARLVVGLFEETAARGGLPAGRPQHGEASYARRRRPEDGRVDWTWPARQIRNLVRALPPPLPPAFTERGDGTRVELTRGEVLPGRVDEQPGVVTGWDPGRVAVCCGDGQLLRFCTSSALDVGERLR